MLATSESVQDRLREVTLPLRHEDIIRQQAKQKDVPPDLIAGIIYAESRFRDQESHAGARGLMQVTPQTAELIEDLSGGSTFVADDLSDPDINIRYGTFYLRHLLDKFDGNLIAALAAYNAGETNVAAWGGADLRRDDIRFEETRDYVDDGPRQARGVPRALRRGAGPELGLAEPLLERGLERLRALGGRPLEPHAGVAAAQGDRPDLVVEARLLHQAPARADVLDLRALRHQLADQLRGGGRAELGHVRSRPSSGLR